MKSCLPAIIIIKKPLPFSGQRLFYDNWIKTAMINANSIYRDRDFFSYFQSRCDST